MWTLTIPAARDIHIRGDVRPQLEALGQIGIGDEITAPADRIGAARIDVGHRLCGRIVAVENEGARIDLADQGALLGHVGAAESAVRSGLAQFEKGQAEFLDDLGGRAEGGCGIAIVAALRFAIGRQPDADPVLAPYIDQRGQHFAQDPGAVFGAAAIFVFAQIGAVAQELVDQIAIGGVKLDPVEAGLLRILGRLAVILDDARDVLDGGRSCLFIVLAAFECVRVARRGRRAGGNRRIAAEEIGMHQPAHVPHLQHDQPAFIVDRLSHLLPALDLFIAPDTGGGGPAQSFDADPRGFGDDQPGTCPLPVICRHHLVGHRSRLGRTPPRERCHENPVRGFEGTHGERLEQAFVHAGQSFLLTRLDQRARGGQ